MIKELNAYPVVQIYGSEREPLSLVNVWTEQITPFLW